MYKMQHRRGNNAMCCSILYSCPLMTNVLTLHSLCTNTLKDKHVLCTFKVKSVLQVSAQGSVFKTCLPVGFFSSSFKSCNSVWVCELLLKKK